MRDASTPLAAKKETSMEPNTPEDPAMAKALARYSVIASVVSRKWPTPADKTVEMKRAAMSIHKFPDAERRVSLRHVRRWVEWYEGGRVLTERTIALGLMRSARLPAALRVNRVNWTPS